MTILDEAARLTAGDRNKDYGHPIDDHTRTGKIWAAILGLDEVTAEQVCLCMVGVKLSRLCHAIKPDSLVDIAGYARCVEMIQEARL